MKRILTLILTAAVVLSSCQQKTPVKPGDAKGSFVLSLTCATDEYTDKIMTKSDAGTFVNLEDFSITLNKLFDEYGEPSTWSSSWAYSEFPQVIELSPGQYKIKVSSPEVERTSTLAPIYSAEKIFTIVEDRVTDLELVCRVTNMKVTVAPTANFFTELRDFTISVTAEYEGLDTPVSVSWSDSDFTANGDGTYSTAKVAYFEAVPLSVMVSGFRTLDGTDAALRKPIVISDVAPRDHHILNVDVQVTGDVKSSMIIVDPTLNDPKNENITVPGFEEIPIPDDEPEDTPSEVINPPYMEWAANPDFAVYMIPEQPSVAIDIYAPGKIAEFKIYVSGSPTFEEIIAALAGENHMDLINNTELEAVLGGMFPNFPIGADKLLGQTYVKFDLSEMVALIPGVDSESTVIFTLEIVDQEGNRYERAVSFKASVTE